MDEPSEPRSSKTDPIECEIILEPVHLTEAQNDERVRRLARKILASIEGSRRRQAGKKRKGVSDDIFKENYDEIFGLN